MYNSCRFKLSTSLKGFCLNEFTEIIIILFVALNESSQQRSDNQRKAQRRGEDILILILLGLLWIPHVFPYQVFPRIGLMIHKNILGFRTSKNATVQSLNLSSGCKTPPLLEDYRQSLSYRYFIQNIQNIQPRIPLTNQYIMEWHRVSNNVCLESQTCS